MVRRKNISTPEKRARVGERIKLAATTAGYSLKELSAHIALPTSIMYQYVRGITSVPAEMLLKIADQTGVPLAFFDPETDARNELIRPDIDSMEAAAPDETDSRARVEQELNRLRDLASAYAQSEERDVFYLSTLEQSLALTRVLSDRSSEAATLLPIGRVRAQRSEYISATTAFLQALQIYEAEGNDVGRLLATEELAAAYETAGLFAKSADCLNEVLRHRRHVAGWRTYFTLADLQCSREDYGGAFANLMRGCASAADQDRDTLMRNVQPHFVRVLARVAFAAGQAQKACELWQSLADQFRFERNIQGYLGAEMETAECLFRMGRYGEAARRAEQAVKVASFRESNLARLGLARAELAEILMRIGQLNLARDLARRSLEAAHRFPNPQLTIASTLSVAEAHLGAEEFDAALDFVDDAVKEAQRIGHPSQIARTLELRARVRLARSNRDRSDGNVTRATSDMRDARRDAETAVRSAHSPFAGYERVTAYITAAECAFADADVAAAEQYCENALQTLDDGAVTMGRLLRTPDALPELPFPEGPEIAAIFQNGRIEAPQLRLQCDTLLARIYESSGRIPEACAAVECAADAVLRIAMDLSPNQLRGFVRVHAHVNTLLTLLNRLPIRASARKTADHLTTILETPRTA